MGQKSSKVHITKTDRAILEVKRSKDEIHKFTRRTDNLILVEKSQLKDLIRKNPENYKSNMKVRFLLKRIHYQEHLLQQASDQLINLENMVSALEFKMVEKQFINGLKNGNEILKKLNKEFSNVDELMDDVQDQIAYQNEINETLSRSVVGTSNYEDDLDKELDALESELNPEKMNNAKVANMPSTEGLPSLPQGEQTEQKEREEFATEERSDTKEPLPLLS
ncbi:ALI_HP2_G0040330.mRNA.1.CDS.1 [Saccharomyces cerevisiae]|nr:ALI_HP2_G0040330.mRNA.1.CDS.1 [Saccharomyces cerevisiae]CAI6618454.1 ALI_HP2_G0040330.mRNA.1.CDS.1 [Saccharomyces cerevisiae]CAI6708718.1 ALI_HP1_G0042180.mRNA.1.CDS.1 [Saccharomyces cerevisiae]CAI6849427.1 ALI_collapsed_G0043560.mRNA.1.CDS.1 [Saccharomyces cerevisiae]